MRILKAFKSEFPSLSLSIDSQSPEWNSDEWEPIRGWWGGEGRPPNDSDELKHAHVSVAIIDSGNLYLERSVEFARTQKDWWLLTDSDMSALLIYAVIEALTALRKSMSGKMVGEGRAYIDEALKFSRNKFRTLEKSEWSQFRMSDL